MEADYELLAHLIDPITKQDKSVTISIIGGQISISVQGYEDAAGGEPILVEFYEGKLRVICWADITDEDYTDAIDMEGAKVK